MRELGGQPRTRTTDEVSGAHDARILGDTEAALPCSELVKDEVARLNNQILREVRP
jgi:hypothetical protein